MYTYVYIHISFTCMNIKKLMDKFEQIRLNKTHIHTHPYTRQTGELQKTKEILKIARVHIT